MAYSDVELEWMIECLEQHGEFVSDLLAASLEKKGMVRSGDLIDSIAYKTTRGANPKLSVNFLSYGRAAEIKYFRKNRKTFTEVNANRVVWGMRNNSRKDAKSRSRKDTRWYARTVYGSLNRLISIVSNELGDEEIARMKMYLEYRKVSGS
jgi:hypothetical protein